MTKIKITQLQELIVANRFTKLLKIFPLTYTSGR